MVKNEIIKNCATATAALCACFLLTACGGGGGGNGNSPAAPMTERAQLMPLLNTASEKAQDATTSTPNAGSVTQSSNRNTGAAGNPTTDEVDGEITGVSEEGRLRFRLTQTNSSSGAWTVTHDDVRRDINPAGARFYGAEMSKPVTLNTVPGTLHVEAYTDYNGAGDSDYLAGGIWLFVRGDTNQVESAGAFVGGNAGYAQANIAALTGSAEYNGDALGVYAGSDDSGGYFDADVALTANFGNAANRGVISGSVFNIAGPGINSSDIVVELQSANIGDDNNGFFTGDTGGSGTGLTFQTGKWGGQFFGAGSGCPGSVGGTFGGAASEGVTRYDYLGVFGAYLTPGNPAC